MPIARLARPLAALALALLPCAAPAGAQTPSTYDVELPSDPIAILRLALSLEAQAVNGYHAFVAQHGDPALRTVAASILACEVTHAVALLQALGDDAAVAFAFATELPPRVNTFLTGYP